MRSSRGKKFPIDVRKSLFKQMKTADERQAEFMALETRGEGPMKRVKTTEIASAIQSLRECECDAKSSDMIIDVLMRCNVAIGYLEGVCMCATMIDKEGIGANIQKALDAHEKSQEES